MTVVETLQAGRVCTGSGTATATALAPPMGLVVPLTVQEWESPPPTDGVIKEVEPAPPPTVLDQDSLPMLGGLVGSPALPTLLEGPTFGEVVGSSALPTLLDGDSRPTFGAMLGSPALPTLLEGESQPTDGVTLALTLPLSAAASTTHLSEHGSPDRVARLGKNTDISSPEQAKRARKTIGHC